MMIEAIAFVWAQFGKTFYIVAAEWGIEGA